jgi:hypothetical protein
MNWILSPLFKYRTLADELFRLKLAPDVVTNHLNETRTRSPGASHICRQELWPSDNTVHVCFVGAVVRSRLGISLLAEYFPQTLQEDAGIVPLLGYCRFLACIFPVYRTLVGVPEVVI